VNAKPIPGIIGCYKRSMFCKDPSKVKVIINGNRTLCFNSDNQRKHSVNQICVGTL
jgi:hypothetical protein